MWKVVQVSPLDWAKTFSQNAHKAVFQELRGAFIDRISYALLVIKDEVVIGYVTVMDYDAETVYWQFGGVLPTFRKSITAVKCIETAIEWQKKISTRILTYVENTNLPMLRFYLAYGFIIIGTRTYNGHTMLDLVKELRDGNEEPIPGNAESKSSQSTQ